MDRRKFPLNVHAEVATVNEGVSVKTKKNIIRVALVGLSLVIAWIGNQLLSDTAFVLVGTLGGFVLGIAISLIIWNHFIIDRDMEKFENSKANKIFKFFKIALTQGLEDRTIESVETLRYTTGETAVMLSVSIGNITDYGTEITEEFFDNLFHLCHKSKVRVKIFTDRDGWEGSNMHLKFLKRVAISHDRKLKETLLKIDKHQTEIFKKSFVPRISFIFSIRGYKLHNLKAIINFVEQWKAEHFKLSTIREVNWQSRENVIKISCEYLGTKMIDVSPLADKERKVVLDIRRKVLPHREDLFFIDPRVATQIVDTNTTYIRKSKYEVKRRRVGQA